MGLGTDSVVSVGNLDMFAEARAAHSLAPSLGSDTIVELCTLRAARALGMDSDTGALQPGKWADCVVLRPPSALHGSPAERILGCHPRDVIRTYLGGREVYRIL